MKDIFRFIGKIGMLSLAFVCLTAPCFVNAQEAASGKITVEETSAPAGGEAENTPAAASNDSGAPYSFTNGRRDPFVPFGGNVAPKPLPAETKLLPADNKDAEGEDISVGKDAKTGQEITTLPVIVTGTVVSGARNFAILAPGGEKQDNKNSVSFMVTAGDKVGEYTVRSVYPDRVVLVWKGKPFVIPVQQYTPKSKDGKAVVGGAPEKATLPVPEIKKPEEDEENAAAEDGKDNKDASKDAAKDSEKKN